MGEGRQRVLVLSALLVALLVAAAFLFTLNRYEGPRGAATGGASGCGGEVEEPQEEPEGEEPVVFGTGEVEAEPAQIKYQVKEGEKVCTTLTVEPMDGIASVDDHCGGDGEPAVADLDEATVSAVLSAYAEIKDKVCTSADCPPGARVEVLLANEQQRVLKLPEGSNLKGVLQKILDGTKEVPLDNTPPPVPEPEAVVVTLAPEQGLSLSDGKILSNASPLKVDLICYASSKTVDLQAGAGPTMAYQKSLKLFRTPGGLAAKFGSLADVPEEAPAETDRDMVHHAQAGNGFSLQGNVSQGWAVLWVSEASTAGVTLSYQWFK